VKRRVCFFAPVRDRAILDRVEFYRQDLRALQQLDVDVHIATTWRELRAPADIYLIWWWTWAFVPLLAAAWYRKPAIITGVLDLQNPQRGFGYYTRPAWQRALMRWSARRATANVFVSRMEHDGCDREFGLTNSLCIPLGVDTALYAPATKDEGAAEREPFICTVAWLHADNAERKGIFTIVRAAALLLREHPALRIVIAGEHGSGIGPLRSLARELGVEHAIDFPGAISTADKVSLMQRCAVYLQPSQFEGFGLAILEAMSCGAPVVSSPVGSVPEVVGDTGVLVDHQSSEEIARAVSELLRDPARRDDLGRRARLRAESQFPLARRQDAMAALIARLLDLAPSETRHAAHPVARGQSSRPLPPS
jgi:glycosyltransferase involved in cell wall biosynthesis